MILPILSGFLFIIFNMFLVKLKTWLICKRNCQKAFKSWLKLSFTLSTTALFISNNRCLSFLFWKMCSSVALAIVSLFFVIDADPYYFPDWKQCYYAWKNYPIGKSNETLSAKVTPPPVLLFGWLLMDSKEIHVL